MISLPQHDPFYHEEQRFNQWWIVLPMLVPCGLVLFGLYVRIVLGQPFGHVGSKPAPLWLDVTMFFVIGVVLPYLMLRLRLEVAVYPDGLYYKFHGLHLRWHRMGYDEMKNTTAVKYRPIMEYGGWGIRIGVNKKAYNVSGNEGVLIELKNGKTVLFGSRRMLEFDAALRQFVFHTNSGFTK